MINGEMSMRKRTKHMIEVLLFALSLLTGILGCVQRTGTLYCDTEVSSKVGIRTLCNGASFSARDTTILFFRYRLEVF